MPKSDRATNDPTRRVVERTSLPAWVKPQLAALVKKAPDGLDWLHEIKLDGYRMHARLDAGRVKIITRRGNDWTQKYPAIANAIAGVPARDAYLDGELCGVLPDGRTAFNLIQNAADADQGSLVLFLFDLLYLDGEDIRDLPLVDRKARLETLLVGAPKSLQYNDHQLGQGPAFHRLTCERGLEGIVSKRIDGRYEPDRRTWLKTKCLNREEFIVVGWSDPEGLQVQLARHSSERDRGLHQSALRLEEVEDAGDAEFGAQFLGPHRSLPCSQVMIADCSLTAPSQKQRA